ncbi:MAG: adenylate/guanylate cyclase domain-containing protein [bacterium]
MIQLVLINAPDRPAYEVSTDVFSIGRLPENHLTLPDALASRKHAEIRKQDGDYRIVDLGSLNGVYVNNLKVQDEKLVHGDVVVIGESKLLFEERPDQPDQEEYSASRPVPGPAPAYGAAKSDAPGLAAPEIVKPITGVEPGHDLEVMSLHDIMKKPEEMSAPEAGDTLRSRYFFILYQVARALNSTNSLSELLDQTMALIFQVIRAERGVIFLFNEDMTLEPVISRSQSGGELPEITISQTITRRAIEEKAGIITADARYDPRFNSGQSIVDYNIHSAVCVPLWERSRTRGAIYLDNQVETYAFSEDDLDLLTAIANQVAIAVQQEEMQERMREHAVFRANLERFHSPDVVGHIMQQSRLDEGIRNFLEEKEVTILFADICSFTPLIEKMDPQQAADLLISYMDEMTSIIFHYKGTVDKFMGDAIMAIFGAPISHGNDAELAVCSAVDMLKKMEEFKRNLPEERRFDIRIGINTGVVISGYLGSKERLEYTVLGDAVNVASRLQNFAEPGTAVVGEDTFAKARGIFDFKDRGSTLLKGKKAETRVYQIVF